MKSKMLLILGALLVVGCGSSAERVDGSSEKAAEASMAKITAKMTDKQKAEFTGAVMIVAIQNAMEKRGDQSANNPYASVNGLTAAEIVEKAKMAVVKK